MPRHFREFVRSQHSRWRDRRPATSSAWGSRRRPDSHLDSDRSGGMDRSNRLLADLSEAQDTNSRLLNVMVKDQQFVGYFFVV